MEMLGNSGLACVGRVYGGSALGLTLAQLHSAGIWARADIPHGTFTLSHNAVALGGTRVLVLAKDAAEAADVLANTPPFVSSSLRGWRMIFCLFFLFYSAAPCSPSAVFSPRRVTGDAAQTT